LCWRAELTRGSAVGISMTVCSSVTGELTEVHIEPLELHD
jgi:hypothetical protein